MPPSQGYSNRSTPAPPGPPAPVNWSQRRSTPVFYERGCAVLAQSVGELLSKVGGHRLVEFGNE